MRGVYTAPHRVGLLILFTGLPRPSSGQICTMHVFRCSSSEQSVIGLPKQALAVILSHADCLLLCVMHRVVDSCELSLVSPANSFGINLNLPRRFR